MWAGIFMLPWKSSRTHTADAPCRVADALDKKRASFGCIHYLLNLASYGEVPHTPLALPRQVRIPNSIRGSPPKEMYILAVY